MRESIHALRCDLENRLFVFQARVVLKPLVSLINYYVPHCTFDQGIMWLCTADSLVYLGRVPTWQMVCLVNGSCVEATY